jgi:hypothetical protein
VREGFQRSINLVFIRLMRDLVRFHEAHLPYDSAALLSEIDHPQRLQFLKESVQQEASVILHRAYQNYRGLSGENLINRLLSSRAQSARHHAILFFAWNKGGDERGLADWLDRYHPVPSGDIPRLYRAYSNPRLNLADYGYLLSLHPLQVWCAGELARNPHISWDELLHRSGAARQISYAWLYGPRHRKAQDLRLRVRIEKDAFDRMTPYWQRLGFPFEHLVPSYATAIGTSSDRPSALADLMGIITNDGLRRPALSLTKLSFAQGTPYETVLQPDSSSGDRVMQPEVARLLKTVLAQVVETGTASRLRGAFLWPDGTAVAVGGKTGSGDNRYKRFNRYGHQTSERAVSRTATFVFYIGDRYYGVITTLVPGRQAGNFSFTSALPVTVMRMLAPAINARLGENSYRGNNSAGSGSIRTNLGDSQKSVYRTILTRKDRAGLNAPPMGSRRASWSLPRTRPNSTKIPESRLVLQTLAPLVRAPPLWTSRWHPFVRRDHQTVRQARAKLFDRGHSRRIM